MARVQTYRYLFKLFLLGDIVSILNRGSLEKDHHNINFYS